MFQPDFKLTSYNALQSYRIELARDIEYETARLSVQIDVLVPAGQTQQALSARLRASLAPFGDAQWSFSPPRIIGDVGGYERRRYAAHTRVPVVALQELQRRAQACSSDGITVSDPRVDYRLPADELDDLLERMRLDGLKRANAQARALTAATDEQWVVASLEWGVLDERIRARVSAKGFFAEDADPDEGMSGIEGLAAQRIAMFADVVLGRVARQSANERWRGAAA